MSSVDLQMLRELSCWQRPPCVSIYLPIDSTHPSSFDATRLALKTLIGDAQHQLQTDITLPRAAIDELLAPAQALLEAEPWPVEFRGYGLFSAPGFSVEAHLAASVPALSVVADRFVATPLVAAVPTHDCFYVVAISQHRVRFVRGHRHGLVDVALPDLPASRADALWYQDHEHQHTLHGGVHHGPHQINGTRHGSPSGHDHHKQHLLGFFRVVDRALWRALHAETAPLFVAGVDHELAIYREANHYTHLAGTVDVGNPERLNLNELHNKVWPVAFRTLDRARRARVDHATTSPTALAAIRSVLTACRQGRVSVLLVQPDRLLWGRADAAEVHPDRRPGDIELVTTVIGAALQHGATIHVATPEELPGDSPVAAIVHR